MEGWISVYRQIQEHWIWKSKEPFDKRSAWLSLLLKANHSNTKIMIDSKLVEVKKGSFITSEVKLSEEWKWGRKKVRTFLKSLEDDKMLTKNSTTKYTAISIEKWDLYQKVEQQKNNNGTTEEQQGNTNNNDNNIYLYLFNKYSVQNRKDFNEFMKKTRELKNDEKWNELTKEKQQKLLSEL